MSKVKTTATKKQELATDTDGEEVHPLSDNAIVLEDQAATLWEKYFYSEPPLSKAEKKEVMLRHNLIAAHRNKIGNFRYLSIITPSTEKPVKRN